ncbi:gamma-butyrobetaine dioxygenase-like [Saccoglossus kowalevskii]|uniref:Gamma-butyrobetaine dioxygenase-like n=1 Tax=Saccoglossus kowalevskii TaxID=10224 RepID=A0ABM0GLN1_SACKO|nr:PREDICTED: gamma-butyrobetaine dioxygenase-like [Saccoglossus kowalevskii]
MEVNVPHIANFNPSSIMAVEKIDREKSVRLEWNDGCESKYPYIWLRENCRCSSCYHGASKMRLIPIANLAIDVLPEKVWQDDNINGQGISISWSDGHHSHYSSTWLRQFQFSDEPQKKRLKLWGSDLQGNIPSYKFGDILESDAILLEWLESLRDVGLVLTKNVPTVPGQLSRLSKRVAPIRMTNYGHEFSVLSKHDPSNLAYTGAKLALHTDLPQYAYSPGIQLLHCIAQTSYEGGVSEFADGINAAMQLKEQDPKAFHILATTMVDFIDTGTDAYQFHLKYSRPLFTLNTYGDVDKVHYNNGVRDSSLRLPLDKVYDFYNALKAYDKLLYSHKNLVTIKLEAGDMIMFNNARTLHGRSQYQIDEGTSGTRHLEGCYFDWDEVYSRIRVLRESLEMPHREY